MENVRIPTQGPTYFPYDRVKKLGDDPLYPLTLSNTSLPNSGGLKRNLLTPFEASYGSIDDSWNKKQPPRATGVVPKEDGELVKWNYFSFIIMNNNYCIYSLIIRVLR